VAPAAGATLTLWCRTDEAAVALAQSPGAALGQYQVASMLTALQVQSPRHRDPG
jgi:hypothetical protein